ncbi:hypothetical protein BT69DRAFT_1317251 [Atractiella rhizophila]|nr:hypothetical protein BT69DRAFT_1317251 [Atractiella rhizophila]
MGKTWKTTEPARTKRLEAKEKAQAITIEEIVTPHPLAKRPKTSILDRSLERHTSKLVNTRDECTGYPYTFEKVGGRKGTSKLPFKLANKTPFDVTTISSQPRATSKRLSNSTRRQSSLDLSASESESEEETEKEGGSVKEEDSWAVKVTFTNSAASFPLTSTPVQTS